jgi:sugar-specific transcriptional regulator TrmB
MGLGLTSCQAKVYLTLCRFGVADAKTVSHYAGVPRQDFYRIVSALEELGLVEKIISRPFTFEAIPIDRGTSLLLERRKLETERLEKKIKDILENFETNNKRNLQLGEPMFILISEKNSVVERSRKSIENAKSSIDAASSWKRFSQIFDFEDGMEKAWSRGVKCRFVTEKPTKNKALGFIRDLCDKNTFCEVRFVPSFPKTILSIYDRKELLLIIDPEAELSESHALWSNNSSLLTAMQDYFEILWITALKEPEYSINIEQN